MKWPALVALARALPEVTLDTWYGTPALKVRGKGFVRLKEDGADVVFVTDGVDEQEALCAAVPDVFHITDHYRGWPAVLARLAALTPALARDRLAVAWRCKAPAALVKAHAGAVPSSRAARPRAPRSSGRRDRKR
jgi:hypothetical protein